MTTDGERTDTSGGTAAAEKASDHSYTPAERRRILVGGSLGWGLEFYDLQLLALVAVPLTSELGISLSTLSVVFTGQLVATAVGGVLFGWLGDLFGRRRVLAWTIVLFAVSTGLVYFVNSTGQLFALRVLTGLGAGGEWALGFSLLNEAWKPRRRGLFGAILQANIWIAYAAAIGVAGAVGDNWRLAFAIGAIPAVAALYVRIRCPESKQWLEYRRLKRTARLDGPERERTPLRQLFARDMRRTTIFGTLAVFGAQYAVYVHITYIPTFLSQNLGYTSGEVTTILLISAALFYVTFIAAGWLSDRWSRRTVLAGIAVVQLVAFLAFAAFTAGDLPRLAIVGSYYLISVGSAYFAIFGAWFGELYPTRVRASGLAWCYSVGRGVAGGAPLVVGLMAGTYGLASGFTTGAAAVVVLLVATAFLGDRSGRRIQAHD